MASATTVLMDDNSVLSELTEETKKSMPPLMPMTPVETSSSTNRKITRASNAIRRASFAAPPMMEQQPQPQQQQLQYMHAHASYDTQQHHGGMSDDEEDHCMRYIPANNNRRASISGPTVEIRRAETGGNGSSISNGRMHHDFVVPQKIYQDDMARSNHSATRAAGGGAGKATRHSSLKATPANAAAILLSVAGLTDDGDGYGTDNESVVSARSIRSMHRRASLHEKKRRSSLSMAPAEPPSTPKSTTSGGSSTSVSELLAGNHMYLNRHGDDEDEEEVDLVHHQHQPVPPMSKRRGSGRALHPDSTPANRGVQRYGTNDSMTMVGMQQQQEQHNNAHQPQKRSNRLVQQQHQSHEPPQRGVQRYGTSDSVGMMNMQKSLTASAPPHMGAPAIPQRSRRGGRRSNNTKNAVTAATEEFHQKPFTPLQDGLTRCITTDSIEAVQVDPTAASPRRGKRGMVQVLYTTSSTEGGPPGDDSDSSLSDPESEVEDYHILHDDDEEEEDSDPASPYQSSKQQVLPQRGMARYSTNDSVTMQVMQVNSSSGDGGRQSPRRGKRPLAPGVHENTEYSRQIQHQVPPQRGVARFATNDSVTMQAMQASSGSENRRNPRRSKRNAAPEMASLSVDVDGGGSGEHQQHRQVAPPQRGVARFATNDSVSLQYIQVDSGGNGQNPRGAGKRASVQGLGETAQDSGDNEQKAAPPQRGVSRFATNDSVTMQAMQVDLNVHNQRRGGKRGEVQVQHEVEDSEISLSDPESPKASVPVQRGVVRYATNDSVTMQVGAIARNPRRGKKKASPPATFDSEQNPGHAEQPEDGESDEHIEYVDVDEVVTESIEEEKPGLEVMQRNTDGIIGFNTASEHNTVGQGRPREDEEYISKVIEELFQHGHDNYGYENQGPYVPMRSQSDDMLSMLKKSCSFGAPQTRRGSTGVMSMRYAENEAHIKRSFRRASTGQNCQPEIRPMPVQSQGGKMGRRNSASSIFTARSEVSHLAAYTPSVVSGMELNEMNRSMHSNYGVGYLPSNQKRHDDSDSEDDLDYGYGDGNNAAHMYGYGTAHSIPMKDTGEIRRRGSESSRKSKQYIRRSSKQGKSLKATAALMSGTGRGQTRASKDPGPQESDSEDSTIYGYGVSERGGHADDSMSESDQSMNSRSSRRSSRSRRCSVVILPDKMKKDETGLISGTGGKALLGLDKEGDEGSDLLNNSAYLEYAIQAPPPTSFLDANSERRYGAVIGAVQKVRNEAPSPKPTHTLKQKEVDSWGRSTPFTTPHSSLTKDALERNLKAAGIPIEQPIHKLSQHTRKLELDSSDDSSTEGRDLYKDSRSFDGFDEYNQRPRRRDSLDKTCVDMGELLEKREKEGKHSKIPKFTPAVNSTNASDYIVRAFQARLRQGISVIKHNRSRWSKSQQRELILLPDGRTLSWKPIQGESDKGKRPKMDLLKCTEVRHAWSKDPDTRKKLGTAVLRSRCKDGSASKSFSLVFNKRTLDMTALTTDSCKLMMEGFSALCFRLQMEKLSQDDHEVEASDTDTRSQYNEGARSVITDDDWASTVYGSTTSRTQTNTISAGTGNSPWGV